jgi:hypothetical protein
MAISMRRAYLYVFLSFFIVFKAHSTIRVAFFEIRDPMGRIIQIQNGSPFAHVAISYGNQWLHAFPKQVIEPIPFEELRRFGHILEIITLDRADLTLKDVKRFLGKEYDYNLDWSTDDKIYDAELVGKLLGIPPEPMSFDAPYWPESYHSKNGEPGLSSGDIYRILLAPPPTSQCAKHL